MVQGPPDSKQHGLDVNLMRLVSIANALATGIFAELPWGVVDLCQGSDFPRVPPFS